MLVYLSLGMDLTNRVFIIENYKTDELYSVEYIADILQYNFYSMIEVDFFININH